MKKRCDRCAHLEYCAQDYQIDLYEMGHFNYDRYVDDVNPLWDYDTIQEFLNTKAWKTCSKAHKKVMDKIDPIN